METQKKQHCKSYKERDRDREKLFASFLHPTTIKAWNFKSQITRASSWWKTQTLERQTDRWKACLLGGMELEAYYWKKDDYFVFRWWICSCNWLVQWQKQQQQQTDRQKKGERGDSWPQHPSNTCTLLKFSSLSLSLSLFPPRNTRKTREEKESKGLELQMEHPTQIKDN